MVFPTLCISWNYGHLAEFFGGGGNAETLQGLAELRLKLGAILVWESHTGVAEVTTTGQEMEVG